LFLPALLLTVFPALSGCFQHDPEKAADIQDDIIYECAGKQLKWEGLGINTDGSGRCHNRFVLKDKTNIADHWERV
jgi:hypothetical protein